jgi:prolyl oligopeptidase
LKNQLLFFAIGIMLVACSSEPTPKKENSDMYAFSPAENNNTPLTYPDTREDNVQDDYHGTSIADPYRWLEDDYSEETKNWVKDQNTVTFGYLDKIKFREALRNRLGEIYNYTKYSTPFKRGDYYYYFQQEGLQNQSVLYRTASLDQPGEIFLDPNAFSEDGTVALGTISMDKDYKHMAYAISRAGSDWQEIYVMRVDDKAALNDTILWAKFTGIAWKDDGFYYNAYPAPDKKTAFTQANSGMQVYYHKLGTNQSDDKLIFEDKSNPNKYFSARTTEDERFLVISAGVGTSGNDLQIRDLEDKNGELIRVIDDFDSDIQLIDSDDDELYFLTNREASNWRLIKFNKNTPSTWEDVIAEDEKRVLKGASFAGGQLYASYMDDVKSAIYECDVDGKNPTLIDLPGIGTASGFGGKKEDKELFYVFTSMISPPTIYRYDIETRQSEVFKKPAIDFNSDLYETKQVFYPSKDGTKIPMFIVHKKGLELNGNNPTWLYAYGGFNISLMPNFSTVRLAWLEQGGVYAMANLRGGGEYGQKWHDGGRLLNKQNVFDDFIAAAEYLIENKYTNKDKIAIHGGSNGGLLVGACMTQRPDLFQVALPAVGVMDMLRYEKFTIGYAWASDYGSVKEKEHFDNIRKYSPLHNLKSGTEYPATMVLTADHDDRVVPAHSFKFAAALQKAHAGANPVLIRVDVDAGHGAGKPTAKILDEYADVMSFMMYNMGVEPNLSKEVKN